MSGSLLKTDPAPDATAGTAVEVIRRGPYIGAEIRGVDLSRPLDETTFAAVHDALMEHEMVFLRGQDIAIDDQMAFGRRFGDLSIHPFSPNLADKPELIVLDYSEDNPAFATDVWHSDESFRETPPMGTILRSVTVPEVGGDTLWASMTAAYEGLSDRIKHLIDGLEAYHDIGPFRRLFPEDEAGRAGLHQFEDMFPRRAHPVVRIHPVTGRKVLFVNPQFTVAIKDMGDQESRSLLDLLFRQATTPEYQFRLSWEPNMLAMWDNRSTQHYAAHDYYPERRKMERVTVAGDRPFGAAEATPTAWAAKRLNRPSGSAASRRADRSSRQFNRVLSGGKG